MPTSVYGHSITHVNTFLSATAMSTPNAFSDTENQPVSNLPATVHFSSTLSQPAVAKERAPTAEGVATSETPRVRVNQAPSNSSVHSGSTARNSIRIREDDPAGSNFRLTQTEEYSLTNKDSATPKLSKNQVNSSPTASTHSSLHQPAQNSDGANIAIQKYSQAIIEPYRRQTLNQSGQLNKESEKLLGIPKYQSTSSGVSY
ncbi:hypothetical protein GYMLUDRAFT_88079 [Collybiopsis luxurians FD-317 M1]|uniref:Uncharacterized protein n=1 Tax=Collybiopsis luxurians FD-317 M1 TaxID=944289 RepID=A0A0D0C8R4_9AGAR|nr:hypothetical protein GYMLUDRAFT_88079 [Collybiopsis luxurians FD-317 M1]